MDKTILYILITFAVSFGLTMLALVDIILKEFKSIKEKVIWHFIAIVPIFGWLIYFIFGARRGQKRKT